MDILENKYGHHLKMDTPDNKYGHQLKMDTLDTPDNKWTQRSTHGHTVKKMDTPVNTTDKSLYYIKKIVYNCEIKIFCNKEIINTFISRPSNPLLESLRLRLF